MIITLAVNAVAQGLMVVHTGGFSPQDSSSPAMRTLATGELFFGLPNALIVWAVVGAGAIFLLNRTTFGRAVYGIGNRERAAYLSGINTQRVVLIAFALAGGLSAFGGVLLAGYASKAAQAMGDAYLLAGDRRRRARRRVDPRRTRQLSRHRRRRHSHHAAAVHPVGGADAGGGAADHLRNRHCRHAPALWAREQDAVG